MKEGGGFKQGTSQAKPCREELQPDPRGDSGLSESSLLCLPCFGSYIPRHLDLFVGEYQVASRVQGQALIETESPTPNGKNGTEGR